MVNSRYPLFSATLVSSGRKVHHLCRAHLLPKLRCQFAEFLNQSFLTRLGMLYHSTCVGFGYGHLSNSSSKLFLEAGCQSIDEESTRRPSASPLRHTMRVCGTKPPTHRPTGLHRDIQYPADLTFSVLSTTQTLQRWCWNVDQLPIDYAFRPRLRSRLTLGGRTCPRNP